MANSSKIKEILDSINSSAVDDWPSYANRYKTATLRYATELQNTLLRDLEYYSKEIMQQHPELKRYVFCPPDQELCSSMEFQPELIDDKLKLVMQSNSSAARELLFNIAGRTYPLIKSKKTQSVGIKIGSLWEYKCLMEQLGASTLQLTANSSAQQFQINALHAATQQAQHLKIQGTFFSPPPSAPPLQPIQLKQHINSLLDAMRILGNCTVIRVNTNNEGHQIAGRSYQYELIFNSKEDGEHFARALNIGISSTANFCSLPQDRSKFYIKDAEHLDRCLMLMQKMEQPPPYELTH